MSAWKLATREIYAAGRPLRSGKLMTTDAIGIYESQRIGLIERAPDGIRGCVEWQLTQLGWDWCEGRVRAFYKRPGGYCWVATWLRALPVGLRLAGLGVLVEKLETYDDIQPVQRRSR